MKHWLLFATLVVLFCSTNYTKAGDDLDLATGIIAIYVNVPAPAPTPTPSPTPAPSNKCVNCRGTGYVGDGTIKTKCPVCDGKGTVGAQLPKTGQQKKYRQVCDPKTGQCRFEEIK